jgi:hypothetical protein
LTGLQDIAGAGDPVSVCENNFELLDSIVPVSITSRGAVADGTTDCTSLIQEVLDNAGANCDIVVPKGASYFKITSSLKLRSGQRIRGLASGGQASTGQAEIRMVGGTSPIFTPKDRTINTVNVCISNLRLTGASGSTSIIDFFRCNYSVVRECLLATGVLGILFDADVGQCYFNAVVDCNVGYVSGTSIRFQNGANTNFIRGGVFQGAPKSIEALSSSSSLFINGAAFQGQDAPDDTVTHIYIDAPEVKIFGCYCEGSSVDCTASAGSTTTATVAGMTATLNQYQNYYILFLTGNNAGQRAQITSHTASPNPVFTFAALSLSVSNGDTFQITRTTGIKCTRNGSFQEHGMTWGGGIAIDVDTGGAVSATGTATAGGASTLTDGSKSWTTNQYQFYRVRITGGTGSGQIRLINSNTATVLSVHDAWNTNPDNTSTYELTEPTCNAWIRSDLKSTAGAGDADFNFHLGVLEMLSAPNGITVPFDWYLVCGLGVENALYRYGRFTRTSGQHRTQFYDYDALECYVDHKEGSFNCNNNTGYFNVGTRGRIKGGSADGLLDLLEYNTTTKARLGVKNEVFTSDTLTYAASVALDFDGGKQQHVDLTGNITFTTSNKAAGKMIELKILADGSVRSFTFPSWKFVGAAAPASIAANKTAFLKLHCYGTADTDIVARYEVEP